MTCAMCAVYRRLFRSGAAIQPLLEELRVENHKSGFVKHLIASLSNTELGFKGRYRESLRTEFQRLGVQRILEGEVDA